MPCAAFTTALTLAERSRISMPRSLTSRVDSRAATTTSISTSSSASRRTMVRRLRNCMIYPVSICN